MPKFSERQIVKKKSGPIKGVVCNVFKIADNSFDYGVDWDSGNYSIEPECELERPGIEPTYCYKQLR